MKKLVSIFVFGILFSGASAAVEIVPTQDTRLLVVNGVETDSSTESTTVDPGFTQIVIKMSAILGKGSSKKAFDSKPYVLQWDAQGEKIEIVAPEVHSYEQAKRYFKKGPEWILLADGKEIDFSINELPPKPGFMPYSSIDEMMVKYNEANGVLFGEEANLVASAKTIDSASAATVAVASGTAIAVTSSNSAIVPNSESTPMVDTAEVSNVNQLKAWYIKANKSERKEFRRWMIDQE